MAKDDKTAPATMGDILELAKIMATKEDLKEMKEEIFHHFDFVVENIQHDLKSANREEIVVIRDKLDDHESRIKDLELRPV